MEIKGLSNYDIEIREGRLTVYSKSHRRVMKLRNYRGRTPGYALQADTPRGKKTIWISSVNLRQLLEHPGLEVSEIYKGGEPPKIKGGGREEEDGELPAFRGDTFRNIDDAMDTLRMLKRAQEGDLSPVIHFLHGARIGAVGTVSGFTGLSCARVDMFWDEAEEIFLGQVRTFRVRRIIPLYPWICKCLKMAIMKRYKMKRDREYE